MPHEIHEGSQNGLLVQSSKKILEAYQMELLETLIKELLKKSKKELHEESPTCDRAPEGTSVGGIPEGAL